MGVDLNLLLVEYETDERWVCRTQIHVHRDPALFKILSKHAELYGDTVPLLNTVFVASGSGSFKVDLDEYAEHVRYLTASQVYMCSRMKQVLEDPYNKAVWAFVGQLRDNSRS
jgi:hypothetical protein